MANEFEGSGLAGLGGLDERSGGPRVSGLGTGDDEIVPTPRRSPQGSAVAPIGSPKSPRGNDGSVIDSSPVAISSVEPGEDDGGPVPPAVTRETSDAAISRLNRGSSAPGDGPPGRTPPGLRGAPANDGLSLGLGVGRLWASPGERSGGRGGLQMQGRVPQPLEGVPSEPYVIARDGEGAIVDRGERMVFAWERSRGFAGCANERCPRSSRAIGSARAVVRAGASDAAAPGSTETAADDEVARVDAGVSRPKVQCVQTLTLPFSAESRSTFCSASCFRSAWGGHSSFLERVATESGGGRGGVGAASSAAAADRVAGSVSSLEGLEALLAAKDALPLPNPSQGGWEPLEKSAVARRAAGADGEETGGAAAMTAAAGREEAGVKRSARRALAPSAAEAFRRLRLRATTHAEEAAGARTVEVLTSHVLPLPPPAAPRRWLPLRTDPATGATLTMPRDVASKGVRDHEHAIRVVSYNTLAEIYATASAYPYTAAHHLAFGYRWRLLARELAAADADILCLQEVQANHFEQHFLPTMRSLGYEGIYKDKTRDPMGGKGKVDGCALFWRTARLELTEKYVIEFNDAALQASRQEYEAAKVLPIGQRRQRQVELSQGLHRLMRDNVAQIVLFRLIKDPEGRPLRGGPLPLVVANTHLFWDPQYADVKLRQTLQLVEALEDLVRQRGGAPLILCGDFNSEPSSAVHQLLSANARYGRRTSLRPEDLPNDPVNILPPASNISHSLFLASAYSTVLGDEPAFTNYTESYLGTLDYIWHTADRVTPMAVLAIPTPEQLRSYTDTPLPNPQYPSDHLCLATDMILGRSSLPAPRAAPFIPSGAAPPGGAGFDLEGRYH